MATAREPSAVAAEIARTIRASGPIDVARFMTIVQDLPAHGYYRTLEPFGEAGDFVTAPEISQMFGELLGLFLGQAWRDLDSPTPFRLVELGPGRGTMMLDMLRGTARIPGFHDAADVHLVERSPRLREVQRQRLDGRRASWHERFEDVPPGPILLVANELLDALPVHQLVRTGDGVRERGIGLGRNGCLAFVDAFPAREWPAVLDDSSVGTIHEVSPARVDLVRRIARRVVAEGGLALMIDYGATATAATGDTLQAVRGHAPVDPLDAPGTADLSTQVDFAPLVEAAAAEGAAVYGPVFQGTFLRTLGIEVRAVRLLEGADAGQARQIRHALFRLTDPSAMGELFKVLVIGGPDAPPPPGFAHDG